MKVLILNCNGITLDTIFNNERIRLIAEEIKKLRPDVVFLQEVFFPWHKKTIARSLSSVYPYRYLPRRGILGTGGGLCCFSRYPIVKKYFRSFSRMGFWRDTTWRDKFAWKGFAVLKIKGPVAFWALNTHLTCNYLADFSLFNKQTWLQKSQLEQLIKELGQISNKAPCFVAGDLNVPPDTDLFLNFLVKTGCRDLTNSIKTSLRNKQAKIDYILLRGGRPAFCRCRLVLKNEPVVSDHYGILMNIGI